MSDGHQTPENGAPDQGPSESGTAPSDAEISKKPHGMLKTAFDDGSLKVMEDEFQVYYFVFRSNVCKKLTFFF